MDLLEKYHGTELYSKHVKDLKERCDKLKALENITFEEMLYNYRKYIRLVSELSRDILTNHDSISLIKLIDLMMKMGYFSYDNQFRYDSSDKNVMYDNMGTTVISGKGVCRHISSFATDVFNASDIFCENFYCLTTNKHQSNTLEGHGNHLANVIEYDDTYYVYDVTNQELYNFVNPVYLVSEDKKRFLYYKPEMQLITEQYVLEDIKKRLENYQDSSLKSRIKSNELHELQSRVTQDIIDNKSIINDFTEETKDIKQKIYTLSKSKKL